MDLSMTPEEEKEILEMFSFEAQEIHQSLNELFTSFEANIKDDETIDEIFRVTHTLKGSAMGMGQTGIADISHVLEDVFSEIKLGNLKTTKPLFNSLYKANDKLGELISAIGTDKKISHKGIKTKLEVILRKSHSGVPESEFKQIKKTKKPSVSEVPVEASPSEEILLEPLTEEELMIEQLEIEEKEEESSVQSIEKTKIRTVLDTWFGKAKKIFNSIYKTHKQDLQIPAKEVQVKTESELVGSTGLEANLISAENYAPEPTIIEAARPAVGEQSFMDQAIDEHPFSENENPRPSLASNDEESVFELLDGTAPDTAEDIDLIDNLSDKVAITDLVQVPIRKLDNLMNQVGQLIIERDRLMSINAMNSKRNTEFASLQRITSELQYSVMDVRLVQIGTLFNKFHRVARDVASIEKKEVKLILKGTDVEIDRNILKIMSESMIHLVRNAVGHGVEDAEERKRENKAAEATITLSARTEKDNVIIEVSDDGQGIDASVIRKKIVEKGLISQEFAQQLTDEDVIMYIFEAGFSNAEQISEVSGRGVGMDVVKKSTESIGGQVYVQTEVGKGTTVTLTLPSSMAVKGVLLFQMQEQEFAFALAYTEAVISLQKKDIHKTGIGLMSSYLKQTISVVFFSDLFYMEDFTHVHDPGAFHDKFDQQDEDTKLDVIVVSYGNKFIGIVVDKLLQQKEIIEKTIPKPLDNNKLLSGTTILGNGNVCLVVDVAAIADILYKTRMKVKETKNVA